MKLALYCKKYDVTFMEIARKCECTPARIGQIAAEGLHSTPSWELALKIEAATEKKVLRTNWYPSPPKGKSK